MVRRSCPFAGRRPVQQRLRVSYDGLELMSLDLGMALRPEHWSNLTVVYGTDGLQVLTLNLTQP